MVIGETQEKKKFLRLSGPLRISFECMERAKTLDARRRLSSRRRGQA